MVRVGDVFRYTYDYGDWWEHIVSAEAVWPADPDERYPVCLEGERACPPEDVGGAYGYAAAGGAPWTIEDHPEHAEMRAWSGGVGVRAGRCYVPAAGDHLPPAAHGLDRVSRRGRCPSR